MQVFDTMRNWSPFGPPRFTAPGRSRGAPLSLTTMSCTALSVFCAWSPKASARVTLAVGGVARSTETEFGPSFAVARSGLPSRLKSATTTLRGVAPTVS